MATLAEDLKTTLNSQKLNTAVDASGTLPMAPFGRTSTSGKDSATPTPTPMNQQLHADTHGGNPHQALTVPVPVKAKPPLPPQRNQTDPPQFQLHRVLP